MIAQVAPLKASSRRSKERERTLLVPPDLILSVLDEFAEIDSQTIQTCFQRDKPDVVVRP